MLIPVCILGFTGSASDATSTGVNVNREVVMRVFVTGATGFIGSAVVNELLGAGHQVIGLARSDAAADGLKRAGVDVQRGDLSDLEALVTGARAADGVMHLAFIHDFGNYEQANQTDRNAIQTLTRALEGSGKPFISTSGTALLPSGRLATERDARPTEGHVHLRAPAEDLVLAAAARGVRSCIVRLPPTVHGRGDHGFIPFIIKVARQKGVAAYVGDGANRWPAVHRFDAARLYRLALEKAEPGTRLHGVAEEGIPMRTIAELIGRGLDVPVRSIAAQDAAGHFDWMANFVAIDNPSSSALTRESLGWTPQHPGLLSDLRDAGYFS